MKRFNIADFIRRMKEAKEREETDEPCEHENVIKNVRYDAPTKYACMDCHKVWEEQPDEPLGFDGLEEAMENEEPSGIDEIILRVPLAHWKERDAKIRALFRNFVGYTMRVVMEQTTTKSDGNVAFALDATPFMKELEEILGGKNNER